MLEATTKHADGDLKLINSELYCTISKAAEICAVSTSTIRRWADYSCQGKGNINIKVLRDPINNYRYLRYQDILNLNNRFVDGSEWDALES